MSELVKPAAVLVAIGCLGIATFQVALAAGAPLGRAAWGGAHERLPRNLRSRAPSRPWSGWSWR